MIDRCARYEVLGSSALVLVLALAWLPADAAAQAYEDSYQTWTSVTVQGNVTPDVAA